MPNQAELIENGNIILTDATHKIADRDWLAHPSFAGVRLKFLLDAATFAGAASCFLVRVEAGHRLEAHVHSEQSEVHEVLAGSGQLERNGKVQAYAPGDLAVIPVGQEHAVQAGPEGLVLRATFISSLP